MGLGYKGVGTSWDWDMKGSGLSGTGTQRDRDAMGLGHKGMRTRWVWDTKGWGHNMTETQRDRELTSPVLIIFTRVQSHVLTKKMPGLSLGVPTATRDSICFIAYQRCGNGVSNLTHQ